MRVLPIVLVVAVMLGCDTPEANRPPAEVSPAPSRAEPTEPPRAAESEEGEAQAGEPAELVLPAPTRVVTRVERWLGWHHFMGTQTLDGPWTVEGAIEDPGDETVDTVGREIPGCRTSELPRDGQVTWCPEVGVVRHIRREGEWRIDERLSAIRRGDVTWAASQCDVMELVDDEERAPLCAHSLRTYGAGPIGRPGTGRCRWRYIFDGPSPGAEARAIAVEIRLARDVTELEEWIGATESWVTFVEGAQTRSWIERGDGWSAAVRVRRDLCGDEIEGAALAARIVELAPE